MKKKKRKSPSGDFKEESTPLILDENTLRWASRRRTVEGWDSKVSTKEDRETWK